ncbi:MAG TPA: TonB-dependent receptor [Steroidobacteraceae bacterium]|nr:TonB-dependent receptor [Steroidobacteraceae bacterium]
MRTIIVLLAAGLPSVQSAAQTDSQSESSLEEIVVTAQKRAQNLQDVPLAITAFTAADIERQNFTNIAQLAEFTPNVIFDTTTSISGLSSGAAVFIRGIGQIDFALTTDPGVGTYLDGVYASRSVGGVIDTLDVERVEILRGPQGTLFGRNTMGGAISVTTRRPGKQFGGSVEVTAGDFNRVDVRGAVDIPITARLGLRLAGSSKRRDGYVERVLVGDDLGDEDRQAFRASVLWSGERFELHATADYARISERSAGSVLAGITQAPNVVVFNLFDAPGNSVPGFGSGVAYDERFITGDPDRSFATGPTGTELDVFGAALTLAWQLAGAELKSISAFRKTDGEFFRDPDGSPLTITHTSNPNYSHEQLTQELQLTGTAAGDSLEYVGGLYYLEEEGTDDVFVPLAPSLGFITNLTDINNESFAAYGQATYRLSERWRVTGGLRYTEEEKTYVPFQRILFGPAGPAPGTSVPLIPDTPVSANFEQTTGRVALELVPNDEWLYYASFTQGFKSGGFNFRYVVPRGSALPFDPETVGSYELGFKWQGADDRVRFNGTAFYMDYEDIQVQVFEVGGGPLTQNSGTAKIKGAELELVALPAPNFRIGVGLGYTDAAYTDLNPPTIALAASLTLDAKLPNTPEFTANASVEYDVARAWGTLGFRADFAHTDEVWNDAQNSPFLFQKAYDIWNGSVRYARPSEAWELVLFGTNLGDERYISSGDSNFGLGFHEANYNRPREVGLTLRWRF